MDSKVTLCPNLVVQFLGKKPEDFRKSDIVRFIKENGIKMVNFMYPADDNRLKTLNFVINSEEYLDSILTYGERVDGSSLFPFIEAGNSDLYVTRKALLSSQALNRRSARHAKRSATLQAMTSMLWENLSITSFQRTQACSRHPTRKDTMNRLPMQSSTISAPSAWHS